MKKWIIAIVVCMSGLHPIFAQSIEMAFALPAQQDQLSNNTAKILRSKLLPAMTENGIETVETSCIAVRPEISFANRQVAEGGMKNIVTSDILFNFTCTNLITGTTFANCVISIRGEGYSDDDAIKNAMAKISPQNQQLAAFIVTSKSKILDYYQQNLNAIISRARTFASIQQYGEGLALLFSCPSTVAGYGKVNDEIVSIYRQYQTRECEYILQKARTEYANGNYEDAANWLCQMDMTSTCGTEAKQLCQKIKLSRDEEAKRIINIIEKQKQREAETEKERIKAARDIAVAYCKQRTNIAFIW